MQWTEQRAVGEFVTETIIQADLMTTMDTSSNHIRCHGNIDLLTSGGDLVLTSTEDQYIYQKLEFWLITAMRERVGDPTLGCPLWDFMHEILDDFSMVALSRAMEYSLRKQLPELGIKQVICSNPDGTNNVNIEFITDSGTIYKLATSEYFGLVDEIGDILWNGNP